MRKIIFNEVEFRNFLSFGNTWQKFRFDNGLSIIQGQIVESAKSNGAGKTSLTELVPFALFGKTIKKINKDKIINWYNEKNCEVRLKFTVDDIPHEIRRGIKPNKLELWVDGSERKKPASVTDFQSQIEADIIGMDFQTFQNLIYFSPNNTISIINAGKPEKRRFLESLFDLSIYSEMLKTINNKLKSNNEKVTELQLLLESLTREKHNYEHEIANSVIPDIRKHQIKLKGLQMQLEEMEKTIFSIQEEDKIAEEQKLKTSQDTLQELKDIRSASESKIALHQKIISNVGDIGEIKKKRSEISVKIDNLNGIILSDEKIVSIEEEITGLVQAKDLKKEKLADIIAYIQGIDKDIAVITSDLTRTRKLIKESDQKTEGNCITCGQPITSELLEQQKIELQKQEQDYLTSLDATNLQKDKENKKKEDLYQQIVEEADNIKEIQAGLDKANKDKEELNRLQERMKDLPETDEAEKSVIEGNEIIDKERQNILDVSSKIHLCEDEIECIRERINQICKDIDKKREHENKLNLLRNENKSATEAYNEMKELADKINKENERKQSMIYTAESEIEQTKKSIQSRNTMTDYLEYVKISLKDENIKRFAISSLIPYLNQQANFYLSESGFPYIVSVDSWLDVTIRGLGVQEVSYGSLSGGETKCIDMAVQLACNDIASMMAKTSMNLMILDEVLDSSVDGIGVQALLNIIRTRQTSTNGAVYIITHRNEIDVFTFDSVVRIINQDKFSRVETGIE